MTVASNRDGQSNVVVSIVWNYGATDGIHVSTNPPGFTNVTYIPGEQFTPFENLTEADVINWVLSSWTSDQLQANQQTLINSITAQQAAQVKILPLPWNK